MNVILNLTIKRRWFDMIASGEKKEEYSDCENRQVQRFLWACNCNDWSKYNPVAIFRNGYRMDSRALAVKIVGADMRGKSEVKHPEWGEPRCRRQHFVVELGEIVSRGTYAEVKEWLERNK